MKFKDNNKNKRKIIDNNKKTIFFYKFLMKYTMTPDVHTN